MRGNAQVWKNRLYSLLLGATVAVLAWIWRFDAPPPGLWESIAAAAGLRPPAEPLPMLWQAVAYPLFSRLGISGATKALMAAGPVSLGVFAFLLCGLFERLLPSALRRGERLVTWWRVAVRFVVFQGSAFLCLSDPVWNAFRCLSPTALMLILAAIAAILFIDCLKFDSRPRLAVSFGIFGLLASESPFGAAVALLATFVFCLGRFRPGAAAARNVAHNPLVHSRMAWDMTLAFIFGIAGGIVLNAWAFSGLNGLESHGWSSWGDYAAALPSCYFKTALPGRTAGGLVFAVAAMVVALLVEVELLRRATDGEKHLKYFHGLAFAAFGAVSFSQLTGAKALWLWSWLPDAGKADIEFLLCLFMFACALSFTWTIAVFTMELYMRDFERVARLMFPDAAEQTEGKAAISAVKRLQRVARAVLCLEPVVVLSFVLPFRPQSLERGMSDLVYDAVRETVGECRGVDFLFTDGGLDPALEVAAAADGRSLRTLSLMSWAADKRGRYLRTRGVDDPTDRALLTQGAPDTLRTWVRTRPEMDERYAVQIGFELWSRLGRPMPTCSGLVARPAGFTPENVAEGSAKARELADRILALYAAGDPNGISDRRLRDAFMFVQWRLAILARHRANACDEAEESELAMAETRLADEMDETNPALAGIRARLAWEARMRLERMTPQEGLEMSLRRANFTMARAFAKHVLNYDPDNAQAHFAIGMDYFVQRQYVRAEMHLRQCLASRPDDPAVLNNLAQCLIRMSQPEKALVFAKRALEILPDSPEVRRTYERAMESGGAR